MKNKNHVSSWQLKKPTEVESTGPWETLSVKGILESYHISGLLLEIPLLERHLKGRALPWNMSFRVLNPDFESQLCGLPAGWPWGNVLPPLNPDALINKRKITGFLLTLHCYEDQTKEHIKEVYKLLSSVFMKVVDIIKTCCLLYHSFTLQISIE